MPRSSGLHSSQRLVVARGACLLDQSDSNRSETLVTAEVLQRLKTFVAGHRHKSLVSEVNCRESGYKELALEQHNEAQLATMILKDLENE